MAPPRRVWTVGHSTYDPEEFLALLRGAQIETVIDVRSTPYSRHASQFNREELKARLAHAGIGYQYEGVGLGGRPEGDGYYDEESHALYERIAQIPAFTVALDRVCERVNAGERLALVCVEENPLDCHRSWFLARALDHRGIEARHIRRDGLEQTPAELDYERTRGQESFFGPEDDVWRSPWPVPRPGRTEIDDL